MPKAIEESLECSSVFRTITLSIRMNHLNQSTFSDRNNNNIEEEEAGKSDEHFDKIGLMSKVRKSFKELILFLEYNHIGKCDLIEKNEKKPEHSDE